MSSTTIKRGRRAFVVLALTVGVASCGGGSARDEAVDRVVDGGLKREVAECVVDATIDQFGEEALAEDFEVPQEEMDKTFDIMDKCLFPDE